MKLSSKIGIAFAIVILLSTIDSYINYVLSVRVEQNAIFLSRSESVIRNSASIHKAILEMQSGFRGFLVTEDTTFLEPYHKGLKMVPSLIAEQKKLIYGNTNQTRILNTIEEMHSNWKDYASSLISSHSKQRLNNNGEFDILFETKFRKQVGKKINDSIRHHFREFDQSEYRLRNLRSGELSKSIRQTHLFSLIFLSFTIIAGIASAIFIMRIISARIKLMVTQAGKIAKGDFNKMEDNRNDELTDLSRSLNIMSDQLNQNIRELQNRNTELNKFAYVVSHDLKAPLRGIHNVIKWIEEDLTREISPAMKNYLDIIPQRISRMESLINGLLDYARISEKKALEEVDTYSLVREITDSLVPRDFIVETHNLPVLFTERLKLEQVFSNLVSNAVKYSLKGRRHIIIGCTQKGRQFYFSVKDNGIGIDPEYHDKIFEIFQTLRDKDEKESTGIGLAIVKKIISENNGEIRVHSALGEGTEFIFTWPVINIQQHEKTHTPG